MKCMHCGYDIPEDEVMKIEGHAQVEGRNTIMGFRNEGVEWDIISSEGETVTCPKCKHETTVWSEGR